MAYLCYWSRGRLPLGSTCRPARGVERGPARGQLMRPVGSGENIRFWRRSPSRLGATWAHGGCVVRENEERSTLASLARHRAEHVAPVAPNRFLLWRHLPQPEELVRGSPSCADGKAVVIVRNGSR